MTLLPLLGFTQATSPAVNRIRSTVGMVKFFDQHLNRRQAMPSQTGRIP